jgi:hypothetical protein
VRMICILLRRSGIFVVFIARDWYRIREAAEMSRDARDEREGSIRNRAKVGKRGRRSMTIDGKQK